MALDFIFMLTANDSTIPDARDRLAEVIEGGARHVGFKDVGLPFEDLKALAHDIRAAGATTYLEVVSLDAESELQSARAAIELEVDFLLGGTHGVQIADMVRGHAIRFYPFPGTIVGHPSTLHGSVDAIAESARRLTELEGVDGLDLLAYRYAGDVAALMEAVCAGSPKPVIMAGSIDAPGKVAAIAAAGAAGFTVGTAAFNASFPARDRSLSGQVSAILDLARAAEAQPAGSA